MEKTKFCSYKTGCLAKGCQMCVKGEKLVLFATGICSRNCYYCPLSEKKKNKDVVYANEWKIENNNDIIKEAEFCSAKGAGITGGDPLLKLERTLQYIKMLKKKFGKNFHIHLYAVPETINEHNLKKLYKAGLDELRLHPNIENSKFWSRMALALQTKQKFRWKIGVEIPAIPGKLKETEKLIDYLLSLKPKPNFININELEVSDTNASHLVEKGFVPKNRISYGVLGSEKVAFALLKKYGNEISMHYCTAKLKDKVQLAKRIKRRAKNVKKEFEIMTNSGSLIRGAIYLKELKPGFGYHKKIQNLTGSQKKQILKKLKTFMQDFAGEFKIPKNMFYLDELKFRILTNVGVARHFADCIKQSKFVPAVVEEYPAWDQMELNIEFV